MGYLPKELEVLAAASPLPIHLQEAEVYTYDTKEFPFKEWVARLLETEEEELGQVHTTPTGRQELVRGEEGRRYRNPWLWGSAQPSTRNDIRKGFNAVLRRFVEHFIAPRMAERDGEVAPVAYQRDVVLRVVLPDGKQHRSTELHCDGDFHHPPSEVNWWVPMTQTSAATNTMYLESRPGRGDFQPVELQYGQVLRFYGCLCQHYTPPNISSSTRVSFDLRVVSLAHHSEGWRDRLGREGIHRMDSYYTRVGGQVVQQEQEVEQKQETLL